MIHPYFGGEAKNLGLIAPLPQQTFADLVKEQFAHPIALSLTRAQFHALPKRDPAAARDQDRAKRTRFVIPGAIPDTTERKSANVTACHLVFLDVDDSDQAQRILDMLDVGATPLHPYGHAIYHTASSTDALPRLRVVVSAEAIPPTLYPAAVSTVARLLGLTAVTSESNVVSQPMFLPVLYRDQNPETEHPLIATHLSGVALTAAELDGVDPVDVQARATGTATAGEADLDHLRAPLDDITDADVREALEHLDADMPRKEWVTVGAALKHQFGDDGLLLWSEWSQKGSKFTNDDDLAQQWKSLKATPRGRVPVTIRTVFKLATDAGWSANKIIDRSYQATNAWLASPERTETDLMQDAIKRIAHTPMLTHLQRGALLNKLIDCLKERGVKPSRSSFTKELRAAERVLRDAAATDEPTDAAPLPMWAAGITYVSQSNEFYRHATGQRWGCDSLNNNFSLCMMTTSEDECARPAVLPQHFLLNKAKIPRVDYYLYDPTRPNDTRIDYDRKKFINTYRATYPEPDARRAEEMGAAIRRHTKLLFGEGRDGDLLIDWMAYQVQNPGIKILWAPFVQGAEGCGKTLYAFVMRLALGETNVKEVAPDAVLGKEWNEWAADTQLVVFEEIRVVGENRHAVMNKIKPLITNQVISINKRNTDTRSVPNYANYFIASNYQDALAINENDRRYFVLFAKQQTKAQVAAIGPEYYRKLYDLLRENAGALRSFLLEWKISAEFNPMQCPATAYKHSMVEAAASPLQKAVSQEVEDGANSLCKPDLVSLKTLRDLIETEHRGMARFSDQALASILREMGFTNAGRTRISGDRHTLWTRGIPPEQACDVAESRSSGVEDLM